MATTGGAQWVGNTTIGTYLGGIIQGGAHAPGAPLVPPPMLLGVYCTHMHAHIMWQGVPGQLTYMHVVLLP